MPKDMQLSLRIRGEYHLMKSSVGGWALDACFVDHHWNLYTQLTHWCRGWRSHDWIISPNNYVWAYVTDFL
jgi:hypothetical protein